MSVPVETTEPSQGYRLHKALAALAGGSVGYFGAGGTSDLANLAVGPWKAKLNTPVARDKAQTDQRMADIADAGGWAEDRELLTTYPEWGKGNANYHPAYLENGKLVERLQLPIGSADEIIAHELGHAMPKGKAGLFIRNLAGKAQSKPMMALPVALAATGLIDEENPVAKAAPSLGAAQLASILAEEMRANIRGHELLKTVGAHTKLRQLLRMSTPSVTYLAKAAPLIAAPIGIAKGIQLYNKAHKEGIPLTPYRSITENINTLANTSPKPVTMRDIRAITQLNATTQGESQ